MRTRAQRRNTISAWYGTLILLTGGMALGMGFWAFTGSQAVLDKVARQRVSPDVDLPVAIDEDSLNIAVQENIKDSLNRPLWAVTRRPYVAPKSPPKVSTKQEAAKKPEPPKEIPPLEGALTSVIIVGDMKVIFLKGGQGVARLEEGMTYNDWLLAKINQDSAEFHFESEKKVLQLRSFATVDAATVRTLGTAKK